MGPTNNLLYLVQHISAVVSKQADQLLQDHIGLSLSQYKILMVLEWNPRVQQKAIADSLGQTEASISRQIKLLERNGLVVTQQDAQNRRKHITAPSLRGMQVTESATNILRRTFGPKFAKMGDDQVALLVTQLQGMHHVICRPGVAGACNHPLGL